MSRRDRSWPEFRMVVTTEKGAVSNNEAEGWIKHPPSVQYWTV